jgi:transcription initiation factor TFIIH subunit 1
MTRMERIRFDIDLSATQEDHIESGNAPDFTMKPGREAQSLPLIRRFNRHSMRVLETALNKPTPETSHAEEIEKGIIISELLDEKPPEKIILDIQDTRRYFESQTRGSDQVSISEEVKKKCIQSIFTMINLNFG